MKTKLIDQDSRSSRRNTPKNSRNSTSPNPKIKGMKVFSRISLD